MVAAAGVWPLANCQARKRATTIGNVYIELMQLVGALAAVALLNTAAHRVFDGQLSVGGLVALQLFLVAALAIGRENSYIYRDPRQPDTRCR